VKKSYKKAIELLKKGSELGSPLAMEQYGACLAIDLFQVEEGRKWLRRSMELGNGNAAIPLARTYNREKNAEGIIQSLRAGAKLGSIDAIGALKRVYWVGNYGQDKNEEYGDRLEELHKSIDRFYAPKPIPDFDQRFPPLPIKPWKGAD
jgi:TPR repeat protein